MLRGWRTRGRTRYTYDLWDAAAAAAATNFFTVGVGGVVLQADGNVFFIYFFFLFYYFVRVSRWGPTPHKSDDARSRSTRANGKAANPDKVYFFLLFFFLSVFCVLSNDPCANFSPYFLPHGPGWIIYGRQKTSPIGNLSRSAHKLTYIILCYYAAVYHTVVQGLVNPNGIEQRDSFGLPMTLLKPIFLQFEIKKIFSKFTIVFQLLSINDYNMSTTYIILLPITTTIIRYYFIK